MPNTKESPLEQTYTMVCDKCGEVFQSPDAWLDPELCPKCRANPVKSRSVQRRMAAQKGGPPPTFGLPPEIQKIREVVARAFSKDRQAQLAFYDDQPGDYPSCNDRATELLSELSKHGVVVRKRGKAKASPDGSFKVVPYEILSIVDGTPVKEG